MSGETPKIDFEALRARLQQGVDRSIVAADAGRKLQSPEGVLPASSDKPRGRVSGVRKENGNEAGVEKLRARWIGITGQSIAEAKNLDDLMKLVNVIQSKRGSAKLSFPLPEELPALLANDKGFAQEFNKLFDKWSNRVIEILFDEEGVDRFRGMMRDRSDSTRGDFFNEYLGRDFRDLKMVPAVIVKMKNLWDKYSPDLKQENLPKRLFKRLVDIWGKYLIPFEFVNEKNGRKLIVTNIDGNHDGSYIEYDYQEGKESKLIQCRITSSEIIDFLKGFQENFGIELIPKKSTASTQNSGSVNRGISSTLTISGKSADQPKVPVKPPAKPKGKDSPKSRRQPPPLDMDDAVSEVRNASSGDLESDERASAIRGLRRNKPVVEVVKITRENFSRPSERTYDELFKEADDGPYHGILFGAAAAGFLTMKEGAQKESVNLKAYDNDHPGEILEALIDGMKDSFHRVGKKLGWSESETDIYARGLVQKSIEKYLK